VKIKAKNFHFLIFSNFLWLPMSFYSSFYIQLQIDAEQAEKDSLEAERQRIEERLQVRIFLALLVRVGLSVWIQMRT
jgi:hypothetical protein